MRRAAARLIGICGRLGLLSLAAATLIYACWQVAFLQLDRDHPLNLTRAEGFSAAVVDRDGAVLRAFTTPDGLWRFPVTAQQVSPLYLAMLKAYEDRRFDSHGGVDYLAAVRAFGQFLWNGEVVSGASTLTMQVARLLEQRPRTLASKLVEMFRAQQLERHLGKDRILALYLTLAPFGGNLEGVRAASLAFFGKEPKVLSPAEAALLVAIPQAPSLLRPDLNPEAARRARDKVLERVAEAGVITARELAEAKEAPVPDRRLAMPFHAPHLAEALVAAAPTQPSIATTIDGRLQAQVETLADKAARLLGEGVTYAVLVVDNATGRVVAHIGSGDYFDAGRSGMIDMTNALRSPGSALKPFIYGLAFERLIAHPDTLVADVKQRFGAYAPTNFNEKFNGEVTLTDALRRSLNIPAVMLLDRVGPLRFDQRLQDVGVTLVFDRQSAAPGLPLALGGAGITLRDLVKLYTGLARGGTPVELTWDPAQPVRAAPAAVVSDVAAWYLTTILEGAPRPVGFRLSEDTGGGNRIAFKTGTAYGYRDAWAVGWNHSYTIGVWAGRADGQPCSGCVGLMAAGPLLFQVFSLLPPEPAPSSFSAPPPGVIPGPTAALPPALRRLQQSDVAVAMAPKNPPVIAFPLDGSTLDLVQGPDGLSSLPLKVQGGLRPYTWLVNGAPLATKAWRGPVLWQPDGPGFAHLQVIDAAGHSATVDVYVTAD